MNVRKASLALGMVLILAGFNAGCSVAEVRGTVVDLEIEPNKKICAPQKPGSRQAPKCTTVPQCYEIDVEDVSGHVHEFCLDPGSWKSYKVGDMFPHKARD